MALEALFNKKSSSRFNPVKSEPSWDGVFLQVSSQQNVWKLDKDPFHLDVSCQRLCALNNGFTFDWN